MRRQKHTSSSLRLLYTSFFRKGIGSVFLLILLCSSAFAQSNAVTSLINEAEHLENEQKYSIAIEKYLEVSYLLEESTDYETLSNVYRSLAQIYTTLEIQPKVQEYLIKESVLLHKLDNTDRLLGNAESLALSYVLLDDLKQGMQKYNEADSLSRVLNRVNHRATIKERKALLAHRMSLENKAIQYTQEAIEIYSSLKDSLQLSLMYNNLGVYFRNIGEIQNAIYAFESSLDLYEKIAKSKNTTESIKAELLVNAAIIARNVNQKRKAGELLETAITQSQKNKNREGEQLALYYLARHQMLEGELSKAILSAQNSYELAKKIGKEKKIIQSLELLSTLYRERGDSENREITDKQLASLKDSVSKVEAESLKNNSKKYIDAEKAENSFGLLFSEKQRQDLQLSQLRLENDNREKELQNQKQELALLERDKELQEAQFVRQKIEQEKMNQDLFISKQKLESEIKESEIKELQRNRELQELALEKEKLSNRDRENEIKILESNNKIRDEQLKNEQYIRYFFMGIGGILFLILIGILFFMNKMRKLNKRLNTQAQEIIEKNEELVRSEEELQQNFEELQATQNLLQKQNNLLEDKNKDITDSINYTRRIQLALLKAETEVASLFGDAAIIMKPRDILSGDFYWAKSIHQNLNVLVVADCTGHGVPGAAMTMIGTSLLYEIFNHKEFIDPAIAITQLDQRITSMFTNESTNSANVADGMDLAMILVDSSAKKCWFAGAKNPLYLVREGKLQKHKGSRSSIGVSKYEKSFESIEIELEKGDQLYLTTDGFQDQFDETDTKKFLSKNLVHLLESNAHLPLNKQKDIIDRSFESWKGSNKQTDDVLLVGVKPIP